MKLELSPELSLVPHCCNCGKAIAKRTHVIWFGRSRDKVDDYWTESTRFPASREEAQKIAGNQQIVSIRWEKDALGKHAYVDKVTTWDGEHYVDDLFCTNRCAIAYARNMARVHKYGRR